MVCKFVYYEFRTLKLKRSNATKYLSYITKYLTKNGCIYSGPCQSDDQCTGNSGADVCVKSEPPDATGECGM